LSQTPTYRLFWADRMHEHFFNNGTLTPGAISTLFNRRVDAMRVPLIAESARWADHHSPGSPLTVSNHFEAAVATKNNTYIPARTDVVFNQLKSQGLYPDLDAPIFNQHGGDVSSGFTLTMSAPTGTIFYTLDNSDPMEPGTLSYSGPVTLTNSIIASARSMDTNGSWSALNRAAFYVDVLPATSNRIAISEIHYHPEIGGNEAEFLEIMNISTQAVDIGSLQFTKGITFDFAELLIDPPVLQPNEQVVLINNTAGFTTAYSNDLPGITIAGQFRDNLDNNGERLLLIDEALTPIRDFRYNNNPPWPESPDGRGPSLTLINPRSNPDHANPLNWRPSVSNLGTPATQDATVFAGNDPSADSDMDGVAAFAEYALGTTDAISQPLIERLQEEVVDDEQYPSVRFLRNLSADDSQLILAWTLDYTAWQTDTNAVVFLGETHLNDGTAWMHYRSTTPLSVAPRQVFRLQVRQQNP
jgi:hypothetical protein